MALAGDIVLARRSFTDVHELVYLFHSWQLILEAEDIPDILRPLQEIPSHLIPEMTIALAQAQAQLESAQSGTEIQLRFAWTPGFAELMRWGAVQLDRIETVMGDDDLHLTWRRALGLARALVAEILGQLDPEPVGAGPVTEAVTTVLD